eukprot:scaffold1281_cov214-Chaetoceros_neogracile.AAC.9
MIIINKRFRALIRGQDARCQTSNYSQASFFSVDLQLGLKYQQERRTPPTNLTKKSRYAMSTRSSTDISLQRHIHYFVHCLQKLPFKYVALDSNR